MNEKQNQPGYPLAARIAVVAGTIAVVICALLLYDYTQRLVKDPLDSATFKTLVAALDQQPTNESLKEQIRSLDLQLRREYFRQRALTRVGAGLLLISVLICLAAAKTAATLHRRMPSPTARSAAYDREAAWTRTARWALAALCLTLVGTAITLSVGIQSEFQRDRDRLATTEPPVGTVAAAKTPPTEEQIGKMWASFRGPGGRGISAYMNVPQTWDVPSGKGVVWKTPVPLPGNNSPVVWGNRVFLTGADQRRREVYCFEIESGELIWRQTVPSTPQSTARPPKIMDDTGYAAPTAVTDGRHIFAIFANGDLAAFDFSGKPVWSKSFGIPENIYGHASSLAMYGNTLLVQLDQGSSEKSKSKIFALDSATGKIVWQIARPVPNSWSSPIVARHADHDQIITAADPWVIAYDAAEGSELWRAKCLETDIGPSPTFADGRVYVANDNSMLSAIRADGRGDVTATAILWQGEDGMPDTCSPLATEEFVFLLASYGTLTCYDAADGNVLWAEDFDEDFAASPSLVGNRLYLIGRTGKAWIVEPSREKCQRIGQADLGEECVTSPAFQDGRIYLRGKKHLFCLGI